MNLWISFCFSKLSFSLHMCNRYLEYHVYLTLFEFKYTLINYSKSSGTDI